MRVTGIPGKGFENYSSVKIENEAENIEDMYLREYIYEQLDIASCARRSLAQDVRWDIQAGKRY